MTERYAHLAAGGQRKAVKEIEKLVANLPRGAVDMGVGMGEGIGR